MVQIGMGQLMEKIARDANLGPHLVFWIRFGTKYWYIGLSEPALRMFLRFHRLVKHTSNHHYNYLTLINFLQVRIECIIKDFDVNSVWRWYANSRKLVRSQNTILQGNPMKRYPFFSMFFAINLISGWILNVLLSLWKHESTQNICPLPRKNNGENNSVLPQGGGLYCREPWWNEQAIWGILFFGLRKVWGAFWGLTVYAHVYLQHFIIS